MNEIVNRVTKSNLKIFDLEALYPEGIRTQIDLKDWLFEGFVLKEADFRAAIAEHDWKRYQEHYVALYCSTDAIIPDWAYMLVTLALNPYAKQIIIGDINTLNTNLYQALLNNLDFSAYQDKPVIIKGCSKKPVPLNAYIFAVTKLKSVAKSIMFGEACSSVPLYKRKK